MKATERAKLRAEKYANQAAIRAERDAILFARLCVMQPPQVISDFGGAFPFRIVAAREADGREWFFVEKPENDNEPEGSWTRTWIDPYDAVSFIAVRSMPACLKEYLSDVLLRGRPKKMVRRLPMAATG